jgi:hypothetical protein
MGELVPAVEAPARRGDAVVVVGHAAHASMPGVDVLMRAKLVDRHVAVVLLCPPAPDGATRDQAQRLGATHVVLLPGGVEDDHDAEPTAEMLGSLVLHVVEGLAARAAHPVPRSPGSADASLDDLIGEVTGPLRIGQASASEQTELLRHAFHSLAAIPELAEVCAALLTAAGEYLPRAVLFLATGNALRPFGACGEPEAGASLASRVRRLRLPLAGGNVVSRAAREGRPYTGPPPATPDDDALRAVLGQARPSAVAALPLGHDRSCCGVLYGDDAGAATALPDLGALATLLGEISTLVRVAVSTAERRADARRALRTS